MAFKIRKLPKKAKEEIQDDDEMLSVNRLKEGEEDGPVSVNRALEDERAERGYNVGKSGKGAGNKLFKTLEEEEMLRQNNVGTKTESTAEVEDELQQTTKTAEEGEKPSFVLGKELAETTENKRETTKKGKKVPIAKEGRNPKLDATPIEEKDLGLPEESFLLDRKVAKADLKLQMDAQEKQFLGGNIRKVRDFKQIFDKGKSSPENPKLDLAYDIQQSSLAKKELIAQQLLRNYKSEDSHEVSNSEKIFKELKINDDEKFVAGLESDAFPFKNEDLIDKIVKLMP